MINRIFFIAILAISVQPCSAQKQLILQDSLASYFKEINKVEKKYAYIWGKNLYGPLLLVDPASRHVFANVSDSGNALKQDGEIYTGILPMEINIANAAINWNGMKWAMIILPLPDVKQIRINLFAHELFHLNEEVLGFASFNTDNNHLDQKEGRIYLRLELEALKKAIQTTNKLNRKMDITNALTFRKYRYSLYPGADSTENCLELNEGLAEYTGWAMSGRNQNQTIEHFTESINTFLNNSTFVRSFAYQTIPMYGYLLQDTKKVWNKELTVKTNLTDYFIKSFHIVLPVDLNKATASLLNVYDGKEIIQEETIREEKIKKLVDTYKNKFITEPHLEISLDKMNMSFDPRNIMPIGNEGTFYPNIRIADNWGILTVNNGALISPDWDKVSISLPLEYKTNKIIGDAWILELKDGYRIKKDEMTGNFILIKKEL